MPGSSNHHTLLVATTGGHLEQLVRLRRRLEPHATSATWVTHDDPQSRSLLADERVHFVPYVAPRGYRAAAENAPVAHRILASEPFTRVVSTGAGVALPFVSAARMRGIPAHYIESAARADGPSLTGRLLAGVPGVRLYTQYRSWSSLRWTYRGSLFDDFEAVPLPSVTINRVVITLGTMRIFEFTRAVDRLRAILPQVLEPGAEVLWQLGATSAEGLPGRAVSSIPQAELKAAIGSADLVISHAGIGSALTALELGHCPVLLPRRATFGEHVDDHQTMIARELDRRGLSVTSEADAVTAADLLRAATTCVTHQGKARPFELLEIPTQRQHPSLRPTSRT